MDNICNKLSNRSDPLLFTSSDLKYYIDDELNGTELKKICYNNDICDSHKSLIIQKILLGYPIKPIIALEKQFLNYEIISGKDIICAIYEFVNNQLTLCGDHILPIFNNKKYCDFTSYGCSYLQELVKSFKQKYVSVKLLTMHSRIISVEELKELLIYID